MVLSKYIIGALALSLAASVTFSQVTSYRLARVKEENIRLELAKKHLEQDVIDLGTRLEQQKAFYERERKTFEDISTAIEELKNEPETSTCGPSVHRALDIIRMRDGETIPETDSN